MSFALIPSYHTRSLSRMLRKTSSAEATQSSFNALWSSGDSAFTDISTIRFSPRFSRFPSSIPLLPPPRHLRMRPDISRIPWPLTFKYDLTKAFEHPPASKLSGTGRGFSRGYLTSAAAALGNSLLPSALPCAFVLSRTTICCCCARFDIFNPLRAWRERLRASKYMAPSLFAKAREMS